MLLKKSVGILIIVLNIGGLGFLLYMTGLMLTEKFFKKKEDISIQEAPAVKIKKTDLTRNNITPDEDDLLKDMDLSDLDDLDLDDFK